MNRLLVILLIISTLSYSQTNEQWKTENLKNLKVFNELKIALENPNEVEILNLRGQNLKEIPKQISELINLRVLLLGWKPKKELDSSTHKKAKNIGGGYLHLDRKKGTFLDYNYIENLTPEFLTLKKLEYLELDYNLIKTLPRELARIKSLKKVSLYGNWAIYKNHKIVEDMELIMPNCEFLTANNFIKMRKKKE